MKKALFFSLLIALIACEGSEGPVGPTGNNGTNGTNGTNGQTTLIALSDGSEHCEGGVKVSAGIDLNNDGVLSSSEVSSTEYVCAGSGGAEGPKEFRLKDFNIYTPSDDHTVSAYVDFDLSNYTGYNAIAFVLRNISIVDGGSPTDVDYTVEAVNASNDNVSIDGSQVTVNNDNKSYVSPNFINSLPEGKFDIELHMFRAPTGTASMSGDAYLVLYKTTE